MNKPHILYIERGVLLALQMLSIVSFFTCFFFFPELAERQRIGKHLGVVALAGIAAMFLIIHLFMRKRGRIVEQLQGNLLAVLLSLIFLFYGLLRLDDYRFWLDEKAYWYIGAYVLYVAYYMTISYNTRFLQWIILAIVLSAAIQASIALLQLYDVVPSHFKEHITGTFFNPSLLGAYLATICPYALVYAGYWRKSHSPKQWKYGMNTAFYTISSLLIIAVLPATYSRAAWMAAIVGVSVLFFSKRANQYRILSFLKRQGVSRLLLAIVTVIIICVFSVGIYHLKKDSADGRLLTWKVCADMISDQPVWGHGFNRLEAEYLAYQSQYFAQDRGSEAEGVLAGNVYWAFNEIIQLTVEFGLVGVVIFLVWLAVTFFPFIRRKQLNRNERAALASLLALLVFGCFSYPFYSPALYLLFLLNMAVLHTSAISQRNDAPKAISVIKTGGVFMIALLSIVNLWFIPSKYDAYWHWDEGKLLHRAKEYSLAKVSYETAHPILQTNGKYLLDYGRCLYEAQDYEFAIEILKDAEKQRCNDELFNMMAATYTALHQFSAADKYYTKASNIVPHKFYPIYMQAKLYLEMGDTLRARLKAEEILNKPIKIHSQQIEQMKEDMLQLLYVDTYDQ